MMSSSQMNLLFNWSDIEGSASVRRCPESSSTNTSTHQRYMCGLAYQRKVPPKFSGIMTATRYSDILSASLVPFLKEKYPHGHRLYQDNDPKQVSMFTIICKYVQRLFAVNGVQWWKSPAGSPDLNPIEMLWGSMKTFIRDKVKPKNLGEPKDGIRKYWAEVTPAVCTSYIDHLQKVMPE